MKKRVKRLVSALLCTALIVTSLGTVIYADTVTETESAKAGICPHHPEHTAECGYRDKSDGSPCSHMGENAVHTDDCYKTVPAATPGEATPGNAEQGRVLDCPHLRGEHDESCGYVPPTVASPCMYICEECGSVFYVDGDGTPHREIVGSLTKIGGSTTKWTGDSGQAAWYYVEGNVTVSERIRVSGDVVLLLAAGSHLNADAGINVPAGSHLTIYGQTAAGGSLTARGSDLNAAIGGGTVDQGAGTITINSGTVDARIRYQAYAGGAEAHWNPAAIGGGYADQTAEVEINGGVVRAESSRGGAGIGGNFSGGGKITITGGDVTAVGGSRILNYEGADSSGGAGIGGGYNSQSGEIEITGGNVKATGGYGAAGIGTGSDSVLLGSVTISGEDTEVRATGGTGSVGIGTGKSGSGTGAVTISDGAKVTAIGERAAIGGTVDLSGAYGEDHMVLGNDREIEAAGAYVVEMSVNGDQRSLDGYGMDLSGYKYLEMGPLTPSSIGVSPAETSAAVGGTVQYAVAAMDGNFKGADLTKILHTTWSLPAGGGSADTAIDGDGLLTVGGDEERTELTVEAAFDSPAGIDVTGKTGHVRVEQAQYQVHFDANGGLTDVDSIPTLRGMLTRPLPTASRENHIFMGWFESRPAGDVVSPNGRIRDDHVFTRDTTVYAGWDRSSHTVTYHTLGGDPETFAFEVKYGDHAGAPAIPVKDLAVFEGWYTDLEYTRRWDFDADVVTEDMDLYARWSDAVRDVTISASASPAAGGRVLNAGKYRAGSAVTLVADANSRYRFLYWMENGEIVGTSPRYPLTAVEDRTLTAVFERERYSGSDDYWDDGAGSGGSGSSGNSGSGSAGAGNLNGAGNVSGGAESSGNTAKEQGPAVSTLPLTVVPGNGAVITTVVNTATNGTTANMAGAAEVSGAWVQNEQGGWHLHYGDGSLAANNWVCVTENDGPHWYHFDGTGLMDTGWLNLDGKVYYLHAVHDGTAGRMLTGWQLLNDKWYYFSNAGDATLGMLLTGTTTPDGYVVNAQGEWVPGAEGLLGRMRIRALKGF